MQFTKLNKILGMAAFMAATIGLQNAFAERPNDGLFQLYDQSFKEKTVAFVPISAGYDLTQGWIAALQRDADRLGYKLIIRDPNWNIDAGAQALEQFINEKPDILIFQNNDM